MKIPLCFPALLVLAVPLTFCFAESSTNTNATSAPIPPDQASLKAEANRVMNEKYEAWKTSLSPSQRQWEEVLDANLGSFYLPGRIGDVLKKHPDAWDYVEDDPKLPRVLLIGDSVSRGYTMAVRAALAGKANVHRAPENCGPSSNGVKKLQVYLGDGKWDVIHFNFGIHDRNTAPALYASNLEQIVAGLQKTGAKLIWARTTPAASPTNNEHYTAEQCAKVNQIADDVMKRYGIPEDDLYDAVEPRLAELQLPNNVHFTDAGYKVLGDKVASEILAAIGTNSFQK